MALTQAIEKARHSRVTRLRQVRAEIRLDEQLRIEKAGDLIAGYVEADKVGDERFVNLARDLHSILTDQDQREALYRLVAEWNRDEAAEDRSLSGMGDHNALMHAKHRQATPLFVDGSWIPGGSDGVA